MNEKYQVGKEYKAKTYNECGYNFPEGKYKIKAKSQGFPENLATEKEKKNSKEQWLEGFEEDKKIFNELYEGIWYYLKFPSDNNKFEWIPQEVMEDAFK